jgi:hypothetical protein
MRVLSVCAAALAIAAATSAGATNRDIETSWGKPGVSLSDYQLDASICANAALELDVASHPATKQLIRASHAMDNAYAQVGRSPPNGVGAVYGGGPDTSWLRDVYRVDGSFYQIKGMMLQVLDGCLTGLGYKEFTLTGEQRARLGKLRRGSQQRRAYLHSLASDPNVLSRQGVLVQ